MILLDSLYINSGGGKVLLDYLVRSMHHSNLEVFYLFDERCRDSYDYIPSEKKIYLSPAISSRHRFYTENKTRFSKVLCFGNIPPTIKLNVPVYTYFQNLILIRQVSEINARIRWSLKLKNRFITLQKKKTDYFIVQSESIKAELCAAYRLSPEKCLVIPFFDEHAYTNLEKKKDQFLYVSDGNGHKNHLRLLEAWKIINQSQPDFRLHLTVSAYYPELRQAIKDAISKGTNIIDHETVTRHQLRELYATSPYLIYPSLMESFGLGLVEAYEAGCEVIAADLPYVHAILKPYKVFDPYSAKDMAAAVLDTAARHDNAPLVTRLKIQNGIQELLNIFAH